MIAFSLRGYGIDHSPYFYSRAGFTEIITCPAECYGGKSTLQTLASNTGTDLKDLARGIYVKYETH